MSFYAAASAILEVTHCQALLPALSQRVTERAPQSLPYKVRPLDSLKVAPVFHLATFLFILALSLYLSMPYWLSVVMCNFGQLAVAFIVLKKFQKHCLCQQMQE